ncbi:MAG: hypothetical protein LUQ44_01790 [Methanothrix sp.]|nr:hypothetical protein [Methanothrix sp.]
MKLAFLVLAGLLTGLAVAGEYEDGYQAGYQNGWAACLEWMQNQTNISEEMPEEHTSSIHATRARLASPKEI